MKRLLWWTPYFLTFCCRSFDSSLFNLYIIIVFICQNLCGLQASQSAGGAPLSRQRNIIFSTIFRVFSFPCICQTRLQSENGGTITARQSTLCQCENTHELYVKIVLLSPKNVNHTSQRCGRFCPRGLFPQPVEQFMSEFKMSAWTGYRRRSFNCPPAWPAARKGRMRWPGSPFPSDLLHPKPAAPPGQFAASRPTSSQICPRCGWHFVRRCRRGGR